MSARAAGPPVVARQRRLKVYGWTGTASPELIAQLGDARYHRQARYIVAAPSFAAASRASEAATLSKIRRDYYSETGNKRELEVALARPGVVFATSLNGSKDQFVEVSRGERVDPERRQQMIDREQAIEAALARLSGWVPARTTVANLIVDDILARTTVANLIVDDILALPDPVHEAARELVAAEDAVKVESSKPHRDEGLPNPRTPESLERVHGERWNAFKRLRAALADER